MAEARARLVIRERSSIELPALNVLIIVIICWRTWKFGGAVLARQAQQPEDRRLPLN
jgi:hypothetical protein